MSLRGSRERPMTGEPAHDLRLECEGTKVFRHAI